MTRTGSSETGQGGGEELFERQLDWPHEAEARFALVVHALPPSGPAPVAAMVLALGRGQGNRTTCDTP